MSSTPAPTIRPKSRDELVTQLARRWLVRKKTASERLDAVLALVLEVMNEQRMEYDYGAVELYDQLLRWKGERR